MIFGVARLMPRANVRDGCSGRVLGRAAVIGQKWRTGMLELIALSLPIWLVVEEIKRWRRKQRHEARVEARKRSRQAAIEALLSRT
jgi:hypothetical protein